jgi:multiple sugar transport system substrate-binding protein
MKTSLVGMALAIAVALNLPTPRSKTSAQEPVMLRIEADDVSATSAMEKSTQQFTHETGIGVVVEKFGYDVSVSKAAEDLASKAGHYDIVLQNADALAKFASQKAIYSIEDLEKLSGEKADFEDDLFRGAWRALSWYKGVKYGYPLAANTMFVVYRKDLIENLSEKQSFHGRYGYDLAPAQNWKQYKDIAEYFTRANQGFYGTLIQGKRFPAVWFEWLNFAFSFGGGVMEKEYSWEYGPIIINSPQTIAGTEYYNSLKKFSPPGYTNFTWNDAIGQMRDGHVFMCVIWSDALFHVIDPKTSSVIGKIGFAPLPAGKDGTVAQVAGSSYFVSRYSKHPKEAFQFELWMLSRQNQIEQELAGGSSPRRSVYEDARVHDLPYAPATAQSLGVARGMIDTNSEAPQVGEIIETAISDVLAGRKATPNALDWAAVELNHALGSKCPLKYPVSAKH